MGNRNKRLRKCMLSDHYITFNSKCCVIYGICCCQAWEKKYLNTDYRRQLEPSYKLEEPCTDVFWFPLFSPEFCLELIDEVEHFGLWSGGKHDVSVNTTSSHTHNQPHSRLRVVGPSSRRWLRERSN